MEILLLPSLFPFSPFPLFLFFPFFPFLHSPFLKNDATTILRLYFIQSVACGSLLFDIAFYGLGGGDGGGREPGH